MSESLNRTSGVGSTVIGIRRAWDWYALLAPLVIVVDGRTVARLVPGGKLKFHLRSPQVTIEAVAGHLTRSARIVVMQESGDLSLTFKVNRSYLDAVGRVDSYSSTGGEWL